jgi:hypothetical protein
MLVGGLVSYWFIAFKPIQGQMNTARIATLLKSPPASEYGSKWLFCPALYSAQALASQPSA